MWSYPLSVTSPWIAAIALLLGILLGAVIAIVVMRSRRDSQLPDTEFDDDEDGARATREADIEASELADLPQIGSDLGFVVQHLPGAVILLDRSGNVVWQSEQAARMRLVRRNVLVHDEMTHCAQQALSREQARVCELTLWRPPLRKGMLEVRIRTIPVRDEAVLLLIDDRTAEKRVAEVRKDFIANVSHELKTPVGAISLLAEALSTATDDPQLVANFSERLQLEAQRLANLINDVIDLSRLQGDEPLANGEAVDLDALVADAVDSVSLAAAAKRIKVITGGDKGLYVLGLADQLGTALRNLLANAVSYSAPDTTVAVAVREQNELIAIDVKDQGIGIAERDLDRIFERFYRVDSARDRATGGTGLGLAIVRNICRNHDGEVTVWSVIGEGSTFTMHLPVPAGTLQDDPGDDTAESAVDPSDASYSRSQI